jgi:hypothetical protein
MMSKIYLYLFVIIVGMYMYNSNKDFELTEKEIGYIGIFTYDLHEYTQLRRIEEAYFFGGSHYTFKIKQAYVNGNKVFIRYVEGFKDPLKQYRTIKGYIENDEVERPIDNRYSPQYFPEYMCKEGTFIFETTYAVRHFELPELEEKLGKYIDIIWENDKTLVVKLKDSSRYII